MACKVINNVGILFSQLSQLDDPATYDGRVAQSQDMIESRPTKRSKADLPYEDDASIDS